MGILKSPKIPWLSWDTTPSDRSAGACGEVDELSSAPSDPWFHPSWSRSPGRLFLKLKKLLWLCGAETCHKTHWNGLNNDIRLEAYLRRHWLLCLKRSSSWQLTLTLFNPSSSPNAGKKVLPSKEALTKRSRYHYETNHYLRLNWGGNCHCFPLSCVLWVTNSRVRTLFIPFLPNLSRPPPDAL